MATDKHPKPETQLLNELSLTGDFTNYLGWAVCMWGLVGEMAIFKQLAMLDPLHTSPLVLPQNLLV